MRTRVAHVTFDMRIGGAEQVIYNLAKHTDPRDYEVSVLCLSPPLGPLGTRLRREEFPVTVLNRQPGFDVALLRDLRRHIQARAIDILHCHQYTPFVYGVLAAAVTRTRTIFTEHGRFFPDARKFKRIVVNPLLSLLTDRTTAISTATRDALATYENLSLKKIQVIYNGLNGLLHGGSTGVSARQELGIPHNALVLGTVARLDPIKNHEMMLRGLNRIRDQYDNVYLVIVGDGPERQRLETLIEAHHLSDRVTITGFREQVAPYYRMMDIFLLTSFSEGTAMTLLEAMACGLPAIVTGVGGNPEIVVDSQTGYIVPCDDDAGLAERIECLTEHPQVRSDMGRLGKNRFKKHFTVDKMVKSYEKLYEEVLR